MIRYAPISHVGHYTFPEGCIIASVVSCPNVTSVTFPAGCTNVLFYYCPGVTSITLPESCTEAVVNDCLNVTNITFPAGCTRARVYNCPEYKSLFDDPRGYQMVYVGGFYHTNCRHFTAAEAIAHWSADSYPDPKRGKAYVAAITAHEAKLQTKETA